MAAAASTFTARTFSTRMIDANTFALTVGPADRGSRTIEIARSAVEVTDAHDLHCLAQGLGGVTSTWTASLVCPGGVRREVARRGGHFISHKANSTAAQIDRIGLNAVIEAATWYCEALDRLTVMVEKAWLALSPKAGKKVRAQMDAGLLRLVAGDLIGGGNEGGAYAVVAGDTVFAVSREYKTKLVDERSYTIGSDAVYGSYNLDYIGEIVSVSPKTIKIVERHSTRGHVLTHSQFLRQNDQPIEKSYKRNADWMD
jgi:hypothetical protein